MIHLVINIVYVAICDGSKQITFCYLKYRSAVATLYRRKSTLNFMILLKYRWGKHIPGCQTVVQLWQGRYTWVYINDLANLTCKIQILSNLTSLLGLFIRNQIVQLLLTDPISVYEWFRIFQKSAGWCKNQEKLKIEKRNNLKRRIRNVL